MVSRIVFLFVFLLFLVDSAANRYLANQSHTFKALDDLFYVKYLDHAYVTGFVGSDFVQVFSRFEMF